MTSVLDKIVRLPRYIKIRSTNGIDENTAIIDKDKYQRDYYIKNRDWILEKKKAINAQPHIKQHNAEYHHRYYLIHREDLNRKHKEYHKRKNESSKMSRT